jgi:hypothetical protein
LDEQRGDPAMKRFIAEQNIEHFRRLLATELSEQRRQCVLQLLAEEEAKLYSVEEEERSSGSSPAPAWSNSKKNITRN